MQSLLKAGSSSNMSGAFPSSGDWSAHSSNGSNHGSPTASTTSSPLGCVARVQVLSDQPMHANAKPGARAGINCCSPAGPIEVTEQQPDTSACLDQDSGAKAVLGPELVGFMLLDPLWEQGQEVGYVASVMRMKRSAHTGKHDVTSEMREQSQRLGMLRWQCGAVQHLHGVLAQSARQECWRWSAGQWCGLMQTSRLYSS